VSPIIGAQLGGHASWAGAPSASYQGGGALAAFLWGVAMDRLGRRRTLALGVTVGALGAALAMSAVAAASLRLFLGGVALMGMANAALQLGRFVAGEVSPPERRGRAIATVVLGGTVGAVFGPLLVGPASTLARSFGGDELAGPYAVSALLFLSVNVIVSVGLRPEPRDLALALRPASRLDDASPRVRHKRPLRAILSHPDAKLAVTSLVCGQAVMVMLMVITSVHMKDHHHALSSIAAVISSHLLGMFAFSVFSGRLADAWGRPPVIAAGASMLALACVTAPLSPRVVPLAAALFLLGLGWNFCYVGGSTLLSDQLSPEERATAQGFNDFLIGAASALGAVVSGIVFGAVGYAVMGGCAAAAALVPLGLARRSHAPRPVAG
jgi:MFS family permease